MARNQYVEINTAFCVPGLSTEEQQRLLAVCDVTPHPLSPQLKEAVQDANLRGYIHLTSRGLVEELAWHPRLRFTFFTAKLEEAAVPTFAVHSREWIHLRELDMRFCGLAVFPSWLSRLSELWVLSLLGNDKIKISDDAVFPPLLRVLYLDGCGLSKVPAGVIGLEHLLVLGLGFNEWGLDLPHTLAKRQRARSLQISGMLLEDW